MVSRRAAITLLLYVAVVVSLLAFCYASPSYNWDMLAYAAVVLDDGQVSPEVLHTEVYRTAAEETPEAEYSMMVDTTHALRSEVLRSPERFYQFLSYFRVKPLYTAMCSALHSLGVPLMKSTVLPSALGIFAIALMLFYRFSRAVPFWAAAILGLSVICTPPVTEAARLSTPDALSTALLVGALLVYLYRANVYWFIGLIVLAVFARLDNVIPATIFLLSLLVSDGKEQNGKAVALVVVGTMVLLFAYTWLIMRYAEYNGGFEEFYGGLTRKWNPVLLVGDALQGLRTIKTSYLALGGISFVVLFHRKGFRLTALDRNQFLFLTATVAVVVRYVLFPDLTTRFFLWYYILCWVLIAEGIVMSYKPGPIERSTSD